MQVTLVTRISSQMILVTFITAPYFKIRAVQTRKRSDSKWGRAEGRGGRGSRRQRGRQRAIAVAAAVAVVCRRRLQLCPFSALPRSAPLALSNAAIFQSSAGMGGCAWRPPCHVTQGAQSNSTIHTAVMFHFVSFHSVGFCGFLLAYYQSNW